MKKRDLLTRSGAGAKELPQCKFFKEMQFIRDVVSNRATQSNLSLPQFQADESGDFEDSFTCTAQQSECNTSTPLLKRKRTPAIKEKQDCSINGQASTSSLDHAIASYLQNENSRKDDADDMFCKSLVPILSSLPVKMNRKAKIEIQKLLYDIEFSED